jgi:hypothetical protein
VTSATRLFFPSDAEPTRQHGQDVGMCGRWRYEAGVVAVGFA